MNKPIKLAFRLCAATLCAHVLIATTSVLALLSGDIQKTIENPDIVNTDLSFPKDVHRSLLSGLKNALKTHPSGVILWGESSHCDLRQLGTLSNPETLDLLHRNGVRTIGLELSPQRQSSIDAVAEGQSKEFNFSGSSICGANISLLQGKVITALIKNATREGINIVAMDANNSLIIVPLLAHASATAVEGAFLSKLSPTLGEAWAEWGMGPFARARMDETDVATMINETRTRTGGKMLVYRGASHVTSAWETALPALYPQALRIAYNEHDRDTCSSTPEQGMPTQPVHFVIDRTTGRVTRCAGGSQPR